MATNGEIVRKGPGSYSEARARLPRRVEEGKYGGGLSGREKKGLVQNARRGGRKLE